MPKWEEMFDVAKILMFLALLFSTFKAADDSKYERGHSSAILAVFCGVMTFLLFISIIFVGF